MKRICIPAISAPLPFLNTLVPSEKYFCDMYGPECTRKREDSGVYYSFTREIAEQINSVTKSYHAAFMKATEKVISSDQLMEESGIPSAFWEPIRKSWEVNRTTSISGRFDFILDSTKTIKLLEYNADSAGALLESAVIQRKWAKSMHLIDGKNASQKLELSLISQWKSMALPKESVLHFMIDNDGEEKYNAAYMQEIASAAGYKSKLCIGLDDFVKDSNGNIFHSDGERVQHVWKMWSWDTVFHSKLAGGRSKESASPQPCLHEILLHPEILVIEPLWKIVTTNKMTMMHLGMDTDLHMLRVSQRVPTGYKYFKKPIAGRGGRGVIFSDEIHDKKTGHQSDSVDSRFIYQKEASQNPTDGWFSTIGSWVVGSEAAGFGVREDKSNIISQESPFRAARIVDPPSHAVSAEAVRG